MSLPKQALFGALAALFFAQNAFAIETAAKEAIVIDDATGTVLFDKNADEKMPPSSMSKLMTIYIIFSKLHEGSLKLTDTMPVSEKAWRTQGSKTFVEIGGRIVVDDLIKGIIIQSGNDACIVMAEGLAGSEESFVAQMNEMAGKLGLTQSHFANATGLPDAAHVMSARDLATLAQHLIHDFPEYYHYFSEKEFVHHGIKQGNRNVLLYKDIGVDGLKTGHTDAGGFGIVVSGKDPTGRRVIIVVNGLENEKARGEEAERLFAFASRDFENVTLIHKGATVDKAKVWYGTEPEVKLTVDKDWAVTLPKTGRGKFKFTLMYDEPVAAPVEKNAHIADLKVESGDAPAQIIPLVAEDDVPEVHGFARIGRNISHFVTGQ
jgi:D-alanyl-D-alanine carboxypeptidase (penicillin-binding protein 5/6)